MNKREPLRNKTKEYYINYHKKKNYINDILIIVFACFLFLVSVGALCGYLWFTR